jgi:type VI secretion system protein ImpA
MDCAEDELVAAAEAVNASFESAKAIDAIFNDRVGTAGPELKMLLSDIYELKKFIEPQLARRMPQDSGDAGAAEGDAAGASGGVAAVSGKIASPQDVMRRIDELCEYYARCEPSSPVPLLLRRAQRLVGKDFSDLLKDLAPSGISELQVITGATDDE